jgi:spore coat polysaccharide biosynthesis protein SpsF (cytidylyltransferase family)
MKILAITQARVGSSRLPGKVLKEINGTSILEMHVRRIIKSKLVSKLIVATTEEPEAMAICILCDNLGVEYYRGSMDDVLDRYYKTALPVKPDYVVRITSDCPLIDPEMIDAVIKTTLDSGADYGSNGFITLFPDGQDVEVFKFSALEKAWKEATLPSDREHVTPYIWRNSSLKGGNIFKSVNFEWKQDYSKVRMTLDESFDLEVITEMVNKLGTDSGWKEYADFYLNEESIHTKNNHIQRNEGYQKSLQKDKK